MDFPIEIGHWNFTEISTENSNEMQSHSNSVKFTEISVKFTEKMWWSSLKFPQM